MTELTHCKTSEKINMPDLIDLQAANVEVIKHIGNLTKWNVRKNITGETLKLFEANITEEFMFQILNFARKFELIAFNTGIIFQKNKQNELLQQKIQLLEKVNKELVFENERLATVLDNMTKEI